MPWDLSFYSEPHGLPTQECRKSSCCPLCPITRDKEGLTTDTGSPHPVIKKSSPHLKETQGVLSGTVAQQIKFTGVVGCGGGKVISLPCRPTPRSQQPPSVCHNSTLLPSFIHGVWRDPSNKWASILSNIIQRLSFRSSYPVTGITRQHCDVFSMRCLSWRPNTALFGP